MTRYSEVGHDRRLGIQCRAPGGLPIGSCRVRRRRRVRPGQVFRAASDRAPQAALGRNPRFTDSPLPVIAAPFMVAMVALHHQTPPERRFWSHTALLMSVVYATYVTLNYVVQLALVIPRLTTEASLAVLDQTPHSLFWILDALGYIFLGTATLFAVPVFAGSASRRWVRRFFLANALVTPMIALVYFYPRFSIPLLFLGTPWLVTGPGSFLLLALMFRREAFQVSASRA